MKYLFSVLLLVIATTHVFSQNVGINSSGAAPDASAMLDIASTTKGLLIPRVALTAINASAPVTSPTVSLLVYNTASASSGSTAVSPGFYYWDGAKWVAISGTNGRDWSLTGNAGTTAGTNFLGTTDNTDLIFKVNSIQAGKINIANNQTFLGYQAGLNSGTTAGNSFFGYNSGIANSSGTYNTALGYLTFTTSTSGNFNTTAGYGSMRNNLSGSNNTFYGVNAGANWSTGANNTGIGMFALQGLSASTGGYNTALGYAAGSGYSGSPNYLAVSSGSYNTFLGYGSAISAGTYSNSSAIGSFASAGASDVMVLGSINGVNTASANTNVLIGRNSNFAADVPMVYTSSALQIENSVTNRNGIYVRNTGTSGSAGVGAYSQNYIGVYGATQNFFGLYGGVVGTPATTAYGVGGTSTVNGSGVPVVTTPGANVGVAGSSAGAGYGVYTYNASSSGWSLYCAGAGDAGKASGTTWIVSDERLKKDIKPIENVLDKVLAMKPVTYRFKDEYAISEGLKIGFLSQDIQKIFPTLVKEKPLPTPYETTADGKKVRVPQEELPEKALYMDMESMTPLLFQAIKEQQQQIEELKAEIKELKKK